MKIELTDKEKQMLWAILNNAQAQGLNNVANLLTKLKDEPLTLNLTINWIEQAQEEYEFINTLKAKLK